MSLSIPDISCYFFTLGDVENSAILYELMSC